MTSYKRILAVTTALTLVPAAGAMAQSEPCDDLRDVLASLPEELPADFEVTRSDIDQAIAAEDVEGCRLVFAAVERSMEATGDETRQAASDTEQAVEQAETTVRLQDEVTVRGTVYLDRSQPSVQVEEGQAEVMVTPANPEVTVREGQAEIVVREKPATITVDMPQPTIRIEQQAPEIVITMPPPGVDVANAQPRVEVRQAEPRVTVSAAQPQVDLELEVAEEGEEGGIQVQDRATGETYAQGETREAQALENADVQLTRAEPIVTLQEQAESDQANVQVQRSEPTVRFERAEPRIQFSQTGEPIVEFAEAGEPTITFRESTEGETQQAAAGESDALPLAEEAEAEVAEAGAEATAEAEAELAEAGNEAAEAEAEIAEAGAEVAQEAETEMAEAEAEVSQELDTEMAETETELAQADTAATAEAELATEEAVELGNEEANPVVEGSVPEGYQVVEIDQMTAEEFDGAPLFSSTDERIGEVGEAIISANGDIQDVIVEIGGFLGIGEHEVAIPFDQLRVVQSEAGGDLRAYVNMTREELEAMPEYED